ncbi:cellulose binding domain-containing protein [Streptomyces sp. NPDC020917]|uniref:glucuronyl esterase domain-containing protein n=1 Tax=Streptomyces sp. NPDC020917 TaxID=3365102 RepID=UPI00378A5DCF
MRFRRYRPRAWAVAVFVAVAGLATTALAPHQTLTAHPSVSGVRAVDAAQAQPAAEDDGADCAVPAPGALTSDALLPDPFKRIDGTRITTKADWRCRREEIKQLSERYVYGSKPAKPAGVTGTVTRTGITVNVSDQGRSSSFSATVDLPSGTGPFPAVIVIGGLGADTATIKASGVAVVSLDPNTVGSEGTPRSSKQGAFYSIYGSSSSTGLLMAWSWGVSRILDVIGQSDGSILRADAMGVTGCSRYGKGAIVAGAFDQRIALTMPIESGSGGVPVLRGIAGESGAQPLSSAYSEQPWLGDAFSSFTGNPSTLPVDMHEIVGMVAPRGLLIMENPHVDWLGARSGSVSALGAAEIYTALGAGGNITYWSDVQDGTHCAVRPEWKTPLQQNLAKFLLKTGGSSGGFHISPLKAGSLAAWRDWQTPTLTDSGTTNGGTSTGTTTGTTSGTTSGGTSTGTTSGTTNGGTSTGTSSGTTSGGSTGGTGGPGTCTATYTTVSSWAGGYQGEVAVKDTGSTALSTWNVGLTLPSGQSVGNLWNGVNTGTTGSITVRNADYNGALTPGASTTFGFVVNASSATPPAGLTCAGS